MLVKRRDALKLELTFVYLSHFCNTSTEGGGEVVTTSSLDFCCKASDSYGFGTGRLE